MATTIMISTRVKPAFRTVLVVFMLGFITYFLFIAWLAGGLKVASRLSAN
jgi:hypothetical protein